jgi:hypothetical protein
VKQSPLVQKVIHEFSKIEYICCPLDDQCEDVIEVEQNGFLDFGVGKVVHTLERDQKNGVFL